MQPRNWGRMGFPDIRSMLEQQKNPDYSDKEWLALALYKEGVNSESDSYSFLSFYKVIELAFDDDEQKMNGWVNENINKFVSEEWLSKNQNAAAYLKDRERHAVAHVGKAGVLRHTGYSSVNPDDSSDLNRIRSSKSIVQRLAQDLIQQRYMQAKTVENKAATK